MPEIHALGRTVALVLGTTLVGFSINMVKYHVRRKAYLLSRLQALELAGALTDTTVDRFVKLSPHLRGEEIGFDPIAGLPVDSIKKAVVSEKT